jgi:hypothetical protein
MKEHKFYLLFYMAMGLELDHIRQAGSEQGPNAGS